MSYELSQPGTLRRRRCAAVAMGLHAGWANEGEAAQQLPGVRLA